MPRTSLSTDDDPLTILLRPPIDESPEAREARLLAEKEAKSRSDAIDEEINRQRLAEKREQKPIKVLLLGQSESGKSTTLKNFQLINSPKAFRAERASWRAVIQLNVVRSIRIILDAMNAAQDYAYAYPSPASSPVDSPSESSRPPSPFPTEPVPTLTQEHLKLKTKLGPLLQVEESLWRRLSTSPNEYEATHLSPITSLPRRSAKEMSIHCNSSWKDAFGRLLSGTRNSMDSDQGIDFDDPKDPGVILYNCSEDMIKLWNDETIRSLLRANDIRLEDTPGFFLNELERITALKYVPSDDDILKARLKTIGVSEHRFVLKSGTGSHSVDRDTSLLTTLRQGNLLSRDWRVYDVGGARTLRAAWAPFFSDDLDAIIFLAPLSCFNQNLAEDPEINRLEDSMALWKSIVSNPLLKQTNLILFLNKCDILRAKLKAGIRFSRWVISYGDRPNTFEATAGYMKKKFAAIHKQQSPTPRPFYCHFTSVIDVTSTFQILENVKDLIVRQNLTSSHLV